VIFSGFVGYLALLRKALEEDGFITTTLTGSMTASQRARAISRFSSDPAVCVILCSVQAAGVGITLTAANHVFLADLWWAPAVDLQAIDRVHRLGQRQTVYVKRFLVCDSVEEKIFKLQRDKLDLARRAFERGARMTQEELRAQRLGEINSLLGRG
jgi:DNA repair protein RAD5